jgi:hypothetical protein
MMPKVEVAEVTVSHIWDDDSKSDIKIAKGRFGDAGPYVSVKDDDETIYFRPESWPEVRDQIQKMFNSFGADEPDA